MNKLRLVPGLLFVLGWGTTLAADETPETIGRIERYAAEFDELVPPDAQIEVLAGGFEWSEGPVWIPGENCLLFSDIPHNRINRFKEGEGVSVFKEPSGYTGGKKFTGSEPGTNGLTLDAQGRLVMCCHGDRVVRRLNQDGTTTDLATHYDGKRFNSPNDLVYHSGGDLYFTDPPYGLPNRFDDPGRELDFCGVYRLTPEGEVELLTKVMTRPNGIGFSPDEKTLYVAQSDPEAPIWRAFDVSPDGSLGAHRILYDAAAMLAKAPGLPDGMAVDQAGNLWATGPGGVLVFSPAGKLLGRLFTGVHTANCTFGDDGQTLYITADMYLCRVKTLARGQ